MPKENLEKRQKSPPFILKTCNIKISILKITILVRRTKPSTHFCSGLEGTGYMLNRGFSFYFSNLSSIHILHNWFLKR